MDTKPFVIISLGGSLIVPDAVDTEFVSGFIALITKNLSKYRFAIITGGGKTCRRYQEAARNIKDLSVEDGDRVGFNVNNMHAEFMRILFGVSLAGTEIFKKFGEPVTSDSPIIMVGAEKPGHSSDFDAVMMAEKLGAKKLINLSNIDYAYDSDPKINPSAKKIEEINWSEFRKLIPDEWSPGLSSPFDPIASKKAEGLGLEVVILNGKNLPNLKNYLDGAEFIGTKIHP